MVKSTLFFLSIFLNLSIYSQDNYDSVLYNKALHAIKDCYNGHHYTWLDSHYFQCLDSGIAVYPYWYLYHMKAMPSIKTADYKRWMENCMSSMKVSTNDMDYFAYVTFYHLKDYEMTLKYLKKYDALTKSPGDIIMNDNILSLYGLCFSEMGELDSALFYFNYLIDTKDNGKNKFFTTLYDYTNRGIVHLKKGNIDYAIFDFRHTLKEYSKSVEGNYYLAKSLYESNGDKNEIEKHLKLAIKSYDEGLKNNHPYGEYVDLPNAVWRSDIMSLYYKIKDVKTY